MIVSPSTGRFTLTRGFTLIELMLVVSIIGLLATVAFPVLQRSNLRARAAERETMLHAINLGIEDAFVRGRVAVAPGLIGAPNPAGAATTSKRPFVNGGPGWSEIGVVVEGNCFYTYSFTAIESTGGLGSALAQYHSAGEGDLDGDTVTSTKFFDATRVSGRWDVLETLAPNDENTF